MTTGDPLGQPSVPGYPSLVDPDPTTAPVLLTGGCGDLGTVLALSMGERARLLDPRPPQAPAGRWIRGSVLDGPALDAAMVGVSAVVHIAAWHGVHLARGWKDAEAFHELNVTGTFRVLEAARRAGARVIFLSSTSVEDRFGVYGHTKVVGEEMVRAWRARGLEAITLRPRAFIPHWNREVYNDYIEWARWFWKGAVHIDDVAQAVLLALSGPRDHPEPLVLDGAYEYTEADLADWGGEATFARVYPGHLDRVRRLGLDPARAPRRLDIEPARRVLGYAPRFSLGSLLGELARHGAAGPPPPWGGDG